MARSRRDPRYSITIAVDERTGRRYVKDGKVRIEWHDEGQRRSRTIGKNSRATRARADELLHIILQGPPSESEKKPMTKETDGAAAGGTVRGWLITMMDLADGIVEGFRGSSADAAGHSDAEASAAGEDGEPDAEIVEDEDAPEDEDAKEGD